MINSILTLAPSLPGWISAYGEDTSISGIAQDSRLVKPGDVFVAYAGGSADGHRFIPDAIQRGAQAVVGTQDISGLPVAYIRVEDSRLALAYLAAAYYDHPARKLLMIGVTGTDGKTTTSTLIFNILREAGIRAGMISTVNAVIGERELDTGFHVTTPDALGVQNYLAQMVQEGMTHVVLEATSHGLAQHRVAACEFDMGVLTNITHEHLDYHGSYAAYQAAKGLLFASLEFTLPKSFPTPRAAILNRDDASYSYISGIAHTRQISYGTGEAADLLASQVIETPDGISYLAVGKTDTDRTFQINVQTPLVGGYNVSNSLAAIGTCVSGLGIDPQVAASSLSKAKGVPGRMEAVNLGQDFLAIVDFAHTPNALRKALEAARRLTQGRVIAVFGSAGLRDREKRRMMAETSAELADMTVLTAEDPRTESLTAILGEMAAGALARGGREGISFWRIADRGEAIRFAVRLAGPGDLVLVCGKGHEQSMCFGDTEYSWDDRVALRAALSELLNIPGPSMPYLPTQAGPQV